MDNFTFIVLTYNHSSYIIQHLESIKYLIEQYGKGISFEIILADDASKDDTVSIAEDWFKRNITLFFNIQILNDGNNKGTCKNFTNAVEKITTQYCKITAGDDVYSYENLFEAYREIDSYHLISGVPLILINDTIQSSKFNLFNLIASNIIYNQDYISSLKNISFFNAPNFLHNLNVLKTPSIIKFINQFKVTEDFPFLIKATELNKPFNFKLNLKTYVYYRRTTNSTYIIKNDVFNQDKIALFNYLINSEVSFLKRLLLKNRKYCFMVTNKYLKKIFNINIYLYLISIVFNIKVIYKIYHENKISLELYQTHYDLIKYKK